MVKVGLASIAFSPDLHALSHEILGIFKEPFQFLQFLIVEEFCDSRDTSKFKCFLKCQSFFYSSSISGNISFLTSLNSLCHFPHFFKMVICLSSVFLFLPDPYLLQHSCGMLILNIPLASYLNESLLVFLKRGFSVLGTIFIPLIQFFQLYYR